MKFIPGGTIAAASGSVGGCVYSRNRYGPYIRNRSIPVNPGSAFQGDVRAALAQLSNNWVTVLTDAERSEWESYAAAVDVPSFGGPVKITGLNWYVAINTPRIQAGLAIFAVPPVLHAGCPLTPINLVSATASTGLLSITFTDTDPWHITNGSLYVYVGRPTNNTINFYGGSYRFATRINGGTATSPASVTSPFSFAAGQKIWVRTLAQDNFGALSTRHVPPTSVIAV